ncbi:MAG: hypothetical protein JRI36_10645, partial [Deltaproteobacteria bacterium]|nr:hypothetical protein [Deltaproteobacteria bacterium]
MSIIFETLNKLRNPTLDRRQGRYRSGQGRLSLFGRRVFLSVGIAFFLACAGIAALYTNRSPAADDPSEAGYRAELMPATAPLAPGQKGGSPTQVPPEPPPDADRYLTDLRSAGQAEPAKAFQPTACAGLGAASPLTPADRSRARAEAIPPATSCSNETTAAARENSVHVVNIKRRKKITTLISRIEKSLAASNLIEAQALVETLATLKPKDDRYVLKLRAYLAIRKDRLDKAAALLAPVLARNRDDLEAGIN